MRYTMMSAILDRAYHINCNTHVRPVPMFWGPPGVGKTQKIMQWINDRGFRMWTLHGSTLAPTDVVCYMPDMNTGQLVPFFNSRLPDARREPDAKGIVFLDEAPNTNPESIKPFQKLVNEGELDGLVTPKGVMYVLAGNRTSDRAESFGFSSAFSNRLEHYEVGAEADEVIDYFASKNYPDILLAYLMLSPASVNRFDPKERTWPNPRTWERLALKMQYSPQLDLQTIMADIGEAEGKQLYAFLLAPTNLPSLEEIVRDPVTTKLPDKASDEYAMLGMLSASVTELEFPAVSTYLRRMPLNRQVLFFKLFNKNLTGEQKLLVRKTEAYRKWLLDPNFSDLILRA